MTTTEEEEEEEEETFKTQTLVCERRMVHPYIHS